MSAKGPNGKSAALFPAVTKGEQPETNRPTISLTYGHISGLRNRDRRRPPDPETGCLFRVHRPARGNRHHGHRHRHRPFALSGRVLRYTASYVFHIFSSIAPSLTRSLALCRTSLIYCHLENCWACQSTVVEFQLIKFCPPTFFPPGTHTLLELLAHLNYFVNVTTIAFKNIRKKQHEIYSMRFSYSEIIHTN